MRARRKKVKITYKECAEKYQTTESAVRQSVANWLNSEGYDSMGNEYDNVIDWLDKFCGKNQREMERRAELSADKTPYMKGDDWDL